MTHKFKKKIKALYSATLPWLSTIILQTSSVHLLNQELQKKIQSTYTKHPSVYPFLLQLMYILDLKYRNFQLANP